MTGITDHDVTTFVVRATGTTDTTGLVVSDFVWDGPKPGHKPRSGVKPQLRLDLIERQGGICPQCGEMLDDTTELNHVVSRGPNRRGWVPGNIFAGHAACNAISEARGPIVWASDMVRPDLVPTEWAPIPVLLARARG